MPKDIVVDFETYYKKDDISASNLGVVNYVDRSYAYIMSIVSDDMQWVGTVEEALQRIPESFWENPDHRFWAANANFDELWVRKIWPEAKMKPWNCVLDRGAASQLPQSLSGICKALWGEKVDKSLRDWMDGRHWKDLDDGQKKDLLGYCLSDSQKELTALRQIPQPSAVEERIAAHTRMANLRGVRIDTERLEQDKQALHQHQHDALQRIPWRNEDAILSHQSLSRWAAGEGLNIPGSLAKDDEECEAMVAAEPRLASVIRAMRQYRKANTLLRKIESVAERVTEAGVMPLELMYCGARHTRRWSSRGVNVQNLDREPYWLTEDGRPAEGGWNVWPRRWLVPRPGKIFLILDFAQIEPRCLNWMVGNDALLEMIRSGFGIYEAYARVAGLYTQSTLLKKTDPGLYKSVKAQVLGLGYGMGAAKFMETAARDGIHLTLPESRAVVQRWRSLNPAIVRMWSAMDGAILDASQSEDRLLEMEMPTGDMLRHFSVRAADSKLEPGKKRGYESFTTKGDFGHSSHQPSLWGGTLVENVTQRMARDVMAESVLRLEDAGLPVIFHAHDEVVVEVDVGNKEEARKEAEHLMSIAPAWAEGLPLAVEGDFSETYTK
jgi:DNA polymerase